MGDMIRVTRRNENIHPWYAACFLCFWKWSRVSEVPLAWNITILPPTPPARLSSQKRRREGKEGDGRPILLARKSYVVTDREQVD